MTLGALSSVNSFASQNSRLANDLFGGTDQLFGGGSAASVFSAGQNDSQATRQALQLAADALKDDLDRLQGFRTELTPNQETKLAELQADIQELEAINNEEGLTERQSQERLDLYQEAYGILGKEYPDTRDDERIQELTDELDTLLTIFPESGPDKRRYDTLIAAEQSYLEAFQSNPENTVARDALRNVRQQIFDLTPKKKMDQLQSSELAEFDAKVAEVNERAGTDLLLTSDQQREVEKVSAELVRMQEQIAAIPDNSAEITPTAAQISRAYSGS